METNNTNTLTVEQMVNNSINNINSLFKLVDEYEAKNGKGTRYGSNWGYAGLPNCLVRAHEVGANNIFFVSSDYHGKYEDDDCYFVYWDELNKEFFEDTWSTRFAAPNYNLYEMPIRFRDAWTAGLIDKEAYLNAIKKKMLADVDKKEWSIRPFDIDYTIKPETLYGIKVTVNTGRKWKGTGYFIDMFKKTYRFATPMYRNYSKDFGLSTSYTAVIYDPETNTINECGMGHMRFTGVDEIIAQYKVWAKDIINSATVENVSEIGSFTPIFAGSWVSKFWINLDYSFDTFLKEWIENHKVDYSAASYPAQEERDRKAKEFKDNKIKELISWVREKHPEENEDWINREAERIFNKNYA